MIDVRSDPIRSGPKQDIEMLTNAVEKERKNVERGVGGRERKQVRRM